MKKSWFNEEQIIGVLKETAPNRGLTKRQGGGLLLLRWTDTIVQCKTRAVY
ncbi:hypothetical protein Tamer19_51050 [Cupriavidus sp. TA19]|nr:hypothetical protein Tamer19_51050 [Cupriavidus sp. TA19]